MYTVELFLKQSSISTVNFVASSCKIMQKTAKCDTHKYFKTLLSLANDLLPSMGYHYHFSAIQGWLGGRKWQLIFTNRHDRFTESKLLDQLWDHNNFVTRKQLVFVNLYSLVSIYVFSVGLPYQLRFLNTETWCIMSVLLLWVRKCTGVKGGVERCCRYALGLFVFFAKKKRLVIV